MTTVADNALIEIKIKVEKNYAAIDLNRLYYRSNLRKINLTHKI